MIFMAKNKIAKELTKPLARLLNSITISNLWLSVLSLAKKENVYAYKLPSQIQKKFGFKPSRLMVYLVLYRLEGEGMLSSIEEGKRRYYKITQKGRQTLDDGIKIF